MSKVGRFAIVSKPGKTDTVHDTRMADERCNLDDANKKGNVKRVTASRLLDSIFLDQSEGLTPCRRCMS